MTNSVSDISKYRHDQTSLKILMIGALPPPIGGATTLFKYLIEDLNEIEGVKIEVINTSKTKTNPVSENNRFLNVLVFTVVIIKTLIRGIKSDLISLHVSIRGKLYLVPAIYLVSRILHKPLMVRSFGGAFDKVYQGQHPILRWVLRKTYFKSEMCLFETRLLVDYFQNQPVKRVEWFSNYTRVRGNINVHTKINNNNKCSRFLFLGWITHLKGIDLMLDAEPMLSDGITIDIYGPLYENYSAEVINPKGNGRILYKGIMDKDEVESHMIKDYDALVLPTFHPTEGYPSVILEAYTCGLPVITTNIRALPEIVDDSCGIIIKPGSVEGFAEAVNKLNANDNLFRKLRKGAIEKVKEFSSEHWTERFIQLCFELKTQISK
ncbi:glycosyltransferase family 4 protein [bacterium]|nr:glycosyltransferase family 4 protein [bacterium]